MKKTYISPSLLVVRIAMPRPLAASIPDAALGDGYVDADKMEVKGVTSDVNLWDEEW